MKKILLGLLAVCLLSPLVAQANLLTNGSFENGTYTGIPGGSSWTEVGPGGTAVTGWVATTGFDWHQQSSIGGEFGPAYDGDRMIDLTRGVFMGGIMQSFVTNPGETYHLTFAVASPITNAGLDVTVAGSTTSYTILPSGTSNMTWNLKSLDFIAVGGLTTLKFEGKNITSWGAIIDDVSVTSASVPEGGMTVALLGMAMSGMVWVRRKLS